MTSVSEALSDARRTGTFELTNQRLDEWPRELLDIPALVAVKVKACQVTTLPHWFGDLRINTLDLAGNRFESFPPEILDLRHLIRLGLAVNNIDQLPGEIDRLRDLRTLVVTHCGLRSLPPRLRNIQHLIGLDLGLNKFHDATILALPSTLRHLALSGNEFTTVPSAVRELRDLRVLEMNSPAWASMHAGGDPSRFAPVFSGGLERRVAITTPDHGSITSLPAWLFEMPKLEWIDVAEQRIEKLPDSLGSTTKVRGLVLRGNRLRELPDDLFELNSLKVLDVSRNSLSALPANLAKFVRLEYVNLAENDLPLPPEVLSDPLAVEEIKDYIVRIWESRRPLDEAKLLVVGEGSVGKSSIIRRLTRGDFDPDERKTEGIDVTRWDLDVDSAEIAVNLWDFGGQEIMHATHQFFLTKRSVYLLVVDARQSEEQNRLEYWLKLIQGFSAGSPVILVGNKCEDFGLDIDHRGLRQKYPDIVDVIETSCVDNSGIDDVRESLRRTLDTLPHVRDELPTSFFAVKEHLEELDADYLTFAAYERLCVEKGVDTAASQELLIGFLHDLGTVLCFRKDPRLRDTNILNPSWVTGGVYRLLNSHAAAQEKGLVSWPVIDSVLDDERYRPDKRQFIVEMMKKFELCYESDDIFLIPDLLTKEEPDTGSWEDSLHFVVRYGVLPSSIIGRLVVRLHRLISQGTVWRTGVVLLMDGNRALVKADREDATVVIKVDGPANGRRGLLTAVRAELRTIERTIPGLTGEEHVPVPGHPSVWVPYTHLLNLESAGKDTVVPQGLVEEFPIGQLLDGIEVRTDRALTRTVPGVRRSEPTEEEPAEKERLRFLGLPKVAGIMTAAGLVIAAVSAVIGLLSLLGDERERDGSKPAPSVSR